MATRFDPFQEMDRLMNQVLGSQRAAATMPMDLYRAGDHYVLHVDLPGADPGSIDVNVDDRTLTIRAQRTARTEDGVQWLAKERPVGTYARQLTVGRGLALDAISASYADGVLTLTIPVAEEAKPRRIEVTTGGTPATIEQRADASQPEQHANA
ncbi:MULTISPECIES: Hsp20/alpha crystallin family protein [Cellulomonas]|uniref:Hsp20/alpha crystallin family protein n=1 Tax=Cellulomonas TaxID=1707 RepID=UPI001B9DA02C|nr:MULTISPECIES: Hsp20/alpha crystallin family protein [Cellulomonas]VTR77508.1 18 kDa heat shock protein [Cellulomonas hominis]